MHISRFYPIRKYLGYYLVLLAASVVIGYAIQHIPVSIAVDSYLYVHINGLPHTPLLNHIISPIDLWFFPLRIIFFMPAYFYFLYAAFFIPLYIFRRAQFYQAVVALVIALVFAAILLQVDWALVFRIRPFLLLPNHVDSVTKHVLQHITSYPSGHTRDTALSATIISKFFPRVLWLMVLLTFIIGFTRVYTGEHYPTDVITGAIYGFVIGLLALKIAAIWFAERKKQYEAK